MFFLCGSTINTVLFFFSSRRRHTRWTGDWSSDVCSSDLVPHNSKILDVFCGIGRHSIPLPREDTVFLVLTFLPYSSPRRLQWRRRGRSTPAQSVGSQT